VRKKAAARMALADGKHLGKQLGEEVVRLMLDNLISDERLLPRVSQHLQTLEPLLMEIAKVDGRFFSDKQHSARQFLDKVTSRSLAFASERDEGYETFVQSMERSIAQLGQKTSAGETESYAFSQAILQLEHEWELQDAQERMRREEAARALLHAEQRNMLAQFLAQEFRANAEGVDVPKQVVDFACGPWAQAVAESQLRCTDGTSDPQGYQELVAELYWSVQPRVAKRNRKRLVQLIPGMLTKLRHGLQLIDFPPERITDFFTDLISMHEAALEGGRAKPAAPEAMPAPQAIELSAQLQAETVTETEDDGEEVLTGRAELEALYAASSQDADAQPVAPAESAETAADFSASKSPAQAGDDQNDGVWLAQREVQEAGFLQEDSVMPLDVDAPASNAASSNLPEPMTPAAIAIGSWVELMLEGQWVRVQLTWASPHRTLFMFVAHGGKAHSMSQRTMDKLRTQGMIRVVSDGHLVERALDAVAQTALRNSVDQGAKKP
jgi:hypothetical protein